MKRGAIALLVGGMVFGIPGSRVSGRESENARTVSATKGLVAFWDFDRTRDGVWISTHDPGAADRDYPVHLKRIGDGGRYTVATWPYGDPDSRLEVDATGPFGKAVRFNQGYIYGAVDRKEFDGTPLDLRGRRPFTLIAWVKFTGRRHMVAGIWDEGGWNRYEGRRQVALFGGLFGQKGVIAHVSATGAASFPQSRASGSQYARLRAIDGKPFGNGTWVAMATTFDPDRNLVTAYLNGVMTPLTLTDPVDQDVHRYAQKRSANPYRFVHPLYGPRAFLLKFNGYGLEETGVAEHRLAVDLDGGTIRYERDPAAEPGGAFRAVVDLRREGASILRPPVVIEGVSGRVVRLPAGTAVKEGDEVRARLERRDGEAWKRVGTEVTRTIREGAPFTFGRALGLGAGEIKHGSQLVLDGVAVFNRVLEPGELRRLSFTSE